MSQTTGIESVVYGLYALMPAFYAVLQEIYLSAPAWRLPQRWSRRFLILFTVLILVSVVTTSVSAIEASGWNLAVVALVSGGVTGIVWYRHVATKLAAILHRTTTT